MSYSSEVLADSPIAYYRLGEASGTTMVDSSGNGRDGAYVNSPTLGATGALTASGDTNTAMVTTADAGTCGSVASASWMNVTNITVEAWVKFSSATDSTNGDAIVSRYGGGGFAWLLWRNPSGQLAAQIVVAGGFNNVTGGAVTLGVWYHVAFTYDGSNGRLYVNGSLVTTVAMSGALGIGPFSIDVGRYSAASQTTPGATIDDVSIFGTALSGARITAHYNAGTAPPAFTGTIAGTSPAGAGAISDVAPTTSTIAGVSPSSTGTLAGSVPTPTGIAGIAKRSLWLRAQDLSGANGSSQPVWRSVEGVLATRMASGGQPTLATAATPLGGQSVRFAGLGGYFLGRAAVPAGIVAVTASSNFSGARPESLFTGSVIDFWSTNSTTTGTVATQYGSPVTATGITLYARGGGNENQAPKNFTVEGSNDGSSWTTVHTVTGAAPTTTGTTYSFTNSTGYTYWRLNVTTVQTGGPAIGLTRIDYTGAPTVALTGTSSGEVWVVIKSDAAQGANSSWGKFGTSTDQSHYPYSGTVYDDFGNATRRSFAPSMSITSTYRVLRMSLSSAGAWLMSLDGTSQLTATSVTAAWPSSVFIGSGSVVAPTPSAYGLTGWIAGVVVFNDALDSTEAATVLSELTSTYIAAPSAIAGTSPVGVGAITGTVATTGTVAGASPSGVGSFTGVTDNTTTGTLTGTSPTGTGTLVGTAPTTGALAGVSPSGVGSLTGEVAAPITGTIAGASPAGVGSLTGVVTLPGAVTGTIAGSGPRAAGSISGIVGDPTIERATVSLTYTPVGIMSVLPLVPVTPLATAVPVTRTSILAPALSAVYPAHPAPGEDGAPEVVESTIGHLQLFISGQNVTNLRGVPVTIRRWESEAPFGDTVAAFEFPQLNPWDVPGEGDLAFLQPDARVVIGMREEVSPGVFAVRRLWSGFLDARGNGLGDGEDYSWEAKGTFWQAMSLIREPFVPNHTVDIGVWIAHTMNNTAHRRWKQMPLTPIGITTTTRGSRDEYVMEYVQTLLTEAITDDLRQWSLAEVAPGVPRLVLKPTAETVHATVAYGTPGVDISLRVDESTRVDRIFMRGIGPKGAGWANIYYPWLEIATPPAYPNTDLSNISAGDTDADTSSGTGVTDWQRRVDELRGFANPPVSGVMSSAWVAVIDDLQRRVGVTADGSLGPQTWNATFDRAPSGSDLTPRRLPMASKPNVEKYLYTAAGVRIMETNPAWDGKSRVLRDIAIDAGPGKSKAEGFKLARKLLGIYGEPAANGTIQWTTDPNETDRTRLSHLSNIKVVGFEGGDRVVQVSSKSVELEASDDGPVYVVTTRVDERARDAMVVEDLLEQRRSAKPDPSRRPGNPAKASRQVSDQRIPWDSESTCGVLRRTAVNGASGLWSVVAIPFAEVGKLAGIRLTSTRPFAFAIFASQRITENKLAAIVGNPFSSSDPWRDEKGQLDEYGIIEAWGEQGNACGYSPKAETDDGAPFTGDFILDTPVDYWTETVPYVSVAFFMRGGSGWIEGEFIPAFET